MKRTLPSRDLAKVLFVAKNLWRQKNVKVLQSTIVRYHIIIDRYRRAEQIDDDVVGVREEESIRATGGSPRQIDLMSFYAVL
jgi:hypothetical protein